MIKKIGTLSALSLLFLASAAEAQVNIPFTQRGTWDGPFEIKMTSSANLQNVFLNATQAASGNLLADSLISNAVMQRTGDLFSMNNNYKDGAIFETYSIPKSAFLCSEPPNTGGCLKGLLSASLSSTCPTVRYGNPDYYTNVYAAMTYADYDTDMSTYSSSMGNLNISNCSEIEAAYLYWTGNFKGGNPNITLVPGTLNSYDGVGTPYSDVFSTTNVVGDFDVVKLKIPGGSYQDVTATTRYTGTETYVCVADVTTMVNGTGGGEFWVGNLKSYPIEGNGGSTSGWTLVVVFRSPLSPPSTISLWDGFKSISSGSAEVFNLTGVQAPITGTFKSYVGFAALDAEDLVPNLKGAAGKALGFEAGNGSFDVNPFSNFPYKYYNKKGYPAKCDGTDNIDPCKTPLYNAAWCSAYDGIGSSQISSYDEVLGTNGNPINRLPNLKNTLGYDAHHVKLPDGAVANGATSANLTIRGTQNGSTMPFMAYIGIERLQPKLVMTKSADKNATGLDSIITYTIKIKNEGNAKSLGDTLGGDVIYDTLDVATNYVASSFAAPDSVTLVSSAGEKLEIKISKGINAGDSVLISFKVKVKNNTVASGGKPLYDACKRTITNTAYIEYNTKSSGKLLSKSNSNDCGIGSEVKILIVDPQLTTSSKILPAIGYFDACTYLTESVLTHVRKELFAAGVAAADTLKYDIRDAANNRVQPEDIFPGNGGTYMAIRDLGGSGTCQDIYELNFKCSLCNPPAKPTFSPATVTACQGDSKTITVTHPLGIPTNANYYITFFMNGTAIAPAAILPNASTSTPLPLVNLMPAQAGTYKVRIEDGNNGASSCYIENSVIVTVTPAISAGSIAADQALCGRPDSTTTPAVLTSTTDASGGSGTITYEWQNRSASAAWSAVTPAVTTATYAPPALGITTIYRRKASAGTVCAATYSNEITITINDCQQLIIPNVYTPNGDAVNPTFAIQGNLPNSRLEVYNRWGKLVLDESNYQNNWNGDGSADGIYYYIYKRPIDDAPHRGWVEIISK